MNKTLSLDPSLYNQKILDSCGSKGAIKHVSPEHYKIFAEMSDEQMELLIESFIIIFWDAMKSNFASGRWESDEDIYEYFANYWERFALGIIQLDSEGRKILLFKPVGDPPDEDMKRRLRARFKNAIPLIEKVLMRMTKNDPKNETDGKQESNFMSNSLEKFAEHMEKIAKQKSKEAGRKMVWSDGGWIPLNMPNVPEKLSFCKKLMNIIVWFIKYAFLIFILVIIFVYIQEFNNYPREHFSKLEVGTLSIFISFLVGLVSYFWGWRDMKRDIVSEKKKRADNIYEDAKNLYENKDYIATIKKTATIVGLLDGFIESWSVHDLLGSALEKLKQHDLAVHVFAMAGYYASCQNDSNATYCYFKAAICCIKIEDWESAFILAQQGLFFNAKNPKGKFVDGLDLETELRTIKILTGLLHIPGKKAFEECKEDAEWLLKYSNNEDKKRFATNFLATKESMKESAKKITDDWLREIADSN